MQINFRKLIWFQYITYNSNWNSPRIFSTASFYIYLFTSTCTLITKPPIWKIEYEFQAWPLVPITETISGWKEVELSDDINRVFFQANSRFDTYTLIDEKFGRRLERVSKKTRWYTHTRKIADHSDRINRIVEIGNRLTEIDNSLTDRVLWTVIKWTHL